MKKFSTEVRLVSKRLGPVEFVAGGFYTNEKNLYRTIITVNTAAGVPLTAPFDLLFVANTISNYEEEPAFGNLTFYRSEGRHGGKEGIMTCRSRGWRYVTKKIEIV